MNAPFQPKRNDGRPLWRVIYDEFDGRIKCGSIDLGALIPDDELRAILTDEEQPRYYAAVLRASEELEQNHKRTLVRDRHRGYRLEGGMEQARQARRQKRKSQRRLERGLSLSTTTDYGLLSADERSSVDMLTRGMNLLAMHAKMTDEKLAAQETQLKELRQQVITSSSRQKATDDEIGELKRRLEAMEAASH